MYILLMKSYWFSSSNDHQQLAPAYTFYNLLFILSLFWSIHSKESSEPVNTVKYNHVRKIWLEKITFFFLSSFQAYAINFASIFFDIAILFFFSYGTWSRIFILLNMFFRVYSLKEIYEEVERRSGNVDPV